MSSTDCLAEGLAPQPSTTPSMATSRLPNLATLASLAIGLVCTPLTGPAKAQLPALSTAQSVELPVTPAPDNPEATPGPVTTSTSVHGPVRIRTGMVTIESDQQRADQLTGVITATGNVRIVYPDERVVATSRQAQYFSREGRVVLSGDVDIVQEGGNLLRAEHVIYLVESERLIAIPPQAQQVFMQVRIPDGDKATTPKPVQASPVQPVVP